MSDNGLRGPAIPPFYAGEIGIRGAIRARAGLVATFAALFRPGDQIALVAPGYPAYRNTLRAMGLEPVALRCTHEQGFKPTPEMIESLDPAPAGFVLASPANPTGAMLDAEAMAAMTKTCRERGIQLISDEIYHGITYGERAASALESDPDAVVINSFSKLYRMPGWRLGWMVVPSAWAGTISAYLINMFLTPPTLAQHAALAAMDETGDLLGHSFIRFSFALTPEEIELALKLLAQWLPTYRD